jgi:hypothetical protein
MGMYTGLRCHVKVKEEFIPIIQNVMDRLEDETWANTGYGFLDEWSKVDRSSFIPFGALAYMPWNENDPFWSRSLTLDGEWKFQCSLKNYKREIEIFLTEVLPKIIDESYRIEYLYEEWDAPDIYKFIDGNIKLIEKHKDIGYQDSCYGEFV